MRGWALRLIATFGALGACDVPAEQAGQEILASGNACKFRAVGFGQTDAEGALSGRKSAAMCVSGIAAATAHVITSPEEGQTCVGDSGGPLVASGKRSIVGVLSGGASEVCRRDGSPSFFISVEATRTFITAAMGPDYAFKKLAAGSP